MYDKNHMLHTDMSLWTPLLTEEAHRKACLQHHGRCCNCGSTEHSLRWCPTPFQNVFSLLNPELATHNLDSSVFETWKRKMRNWRRKGLSADTKVTVHDALTILDPTLPLKVITLGPRLLPAWQRLKPTACGPRYALWPYIFNQ